MFQFSGAEKRMARSKGDFPLLSFEQQVKIKVKKIGLILEQCRI